MAPWSSARRCSIDAGTVVRGGILFLVDFAISRGAPTATILASST